MAQSAIAAEGLDFFPLDIEEGPAQFRRPSNMGFLRYLSTVQALKDQATRVMRVAPAALQALRIEALVVDELDIAAGTVAERLGLPFVTLSCGIPMYLSDTLPSPYFGWPQRRGRLAALRNRAGNMLVNGLAGSALQIVNQQRIAWGMAPLRNVNDVFSKSAVITQLPEELDFRRGQTPPNLHYSGPFFNERNAERDIWHRKFPWHRLTGKTLIYASMGTIRNTMPWVFKAIVQACESLDVQLVLSVGGGAVNAATLSRTKGDTIVVHYAPQRALLARAALAVNCAGLNTTLDCLASGVPIVAIPVAEDQPGVAARIRHAGIGRVIPLRALTVRALRNALETVLKDPAYRASACRFRSEIGRMDGAGRAADIVENVLRLSVAEGGKVIGVEG